MKVFECVSYFFNSQSWGEGNRYGAERSEIN